MRHHANSFQLVIEICDITKQCRQGVIFFLSVVPQIHICRHKQACGVRNSTGIISEHVNVICNWSIPLPFSCQLLNTPLYVSRWVFTWCFCWLVCITHRIFATWQAYVNIDTEKIQAMRIKLQMISTMSYTQCGLPTSNSLGVNSFFLSLEL